MKFKPTLPGLMILCAAPALAEPFEGPGYLTGCQNDLCEINAAGVFFYVEGGAGTDTDLMVRMYDMGIGIWPIWFSGDYSNLGDVSADLVLTALEDRPDDPFAETLAYIQGNWLPRGEESPFHIRIDGMVWTEVLEGDSETPYQIFPSETCADGVAPGGMVLSLVPLGAEPVEAACWQIEYATDTELDLRNITGGFTPVELDRMN